MKKVVKIFLLLSICFSIYPSFLFAAVDDTQVIDKLNDNNTETLKYDFKLKKFQSCDDMSNVLSDFVKKYYKDRPVFYR
jgi:hypothetical protein